uniref:BZIP domain-containing protein n=1 Tax=Panagrolaimus sp. JU765 TaxID=591449 RepID=A0AC34QFQ8_9BILA
MIFFSANRRGSFPLPRSLAQSALTNQLTKSGLTASNFIAETPTPTKILYPKQITKEQQEFVDGFNKALEEIQSRNQFNAKALEEIQSRNQFNASNLSSPTNSGLLIPLLAALTPTITNQTNLSSVQNTSSITNALIAALTPTLTPSQTQTSEQILAAFASLTNTPTGVSPTTTLPKTEIVNPIISVPNSVNSLPPTSVPTTTVTSVNSLPPTSVPTTTATSNLMDNMFSTHPDLNNFMNHFNQNVLPPHSQPLSVHNGIYHQQQNIQLQTQVPLNVKVEPGANNNYNGICQPPPQMCSASTSHPGSNYSMPHSIGSNDEFRMDMTEQERRKLERKRARNRMAASKCRQRKIERIQQLETEVQQERQRYANLQQSISSLEKTITMLQNELSRHKNSGCSLEKTTLHLMSHINNLVNSNVNMGIDSV